MNLVLVPEDILEALLLNAELLIAGMDNRPVEKQIAMLSGYCLRPAALRSGCATQEGSAEIIDLFTRTRL